MLVSKTKGDENCLKAKKQLRALSGRSLSIEFFGKRILVLIKCMGPRLQHGQDHGVPFYESGLL